MTIKSRFKIGKKAEALALNYLQNNLNSDTAIFPGKSEKCDFLVKSKRSIQKVEIKSCSNYGRFMIHYAQYKTLTASKRDFNNSIWIFVWFTGSDVLIKKLSSSQFSKIIAKTRLTSCMVGYGKTKLLTEKEYLKNQSKIVDKWTERHGVDGKSLFKVKYKRISKLYNISPKRIFNTQECPVN